jgi:hypothetical protein
LNDPRGFPVWLVALVGFTLGWALRQLDNYFEWRRNKGKDESKEMVVKLLERAMKVFENKPDPPITAPPMPEIQGRCVICGKNVEMTPTRELIEKAHGVIFCDGCMPAAVASQMAEVSESERQVKPVGTCESCSADLFSLADGVKHHQAGHSLSWRTPEDSDDFYRAYPRPVDLG